jgi:hypothetical protein
MNPWTGRLLRVAFALALLATVLHLTAYAQTAAAAPTAEQLLQGAEHLGAGRVAAYRLTNAAARTLVESGDDTVFASWLRTSLPPLRTRLEVAARRAASEPDRLHFADMAARVERLSALGKP